MCVCRRVYGPMLWLVLWQGTAEEEQFTCTGVPMARTQMPILNRAELATGFSSHAYQGYRLPFQRSGSRWLDPTGDMMVKKNPYAAFELCCLAK